jgi:hypothetical protein
MAKMQTRVLLARGHGAGENDGVSFNLLAENPWIRAYWFTNSPLNRRMDVVLMSSIWVGNARRWDGGREVCLRAASALKKAIYKEGDLKILPRPQNPALFPEVNFGSSFYVSSHLTCES